MDFKQADQYLHSFIDYEKKMPDSEDAFTLKHLQSLLRAAGNPEKNLRVIHIAGTKGKGSTAVMTASVLRQAGFRAGLFTSPHLYSFRERVRLLSLDKKNLSSGGDLFPDCIKEEVFADIMTRLEPVVEELRNKEKDFRLTYFEALTAAALIFFAREKADWVVLETGLGGRLDATNSADSAVAVITKIGYDHISILGETLEDIAAEKAAIIKSKNQKVVLAPQTPEVLRLLQKRCSDFGIDPVQVQEPDRDAETFSYGGYKDLRIPLKGIHQRINAATAIEIIEQLKYFGAEISEEDVRQGLADVFWPGRFEELSFKGRRVILDGAHNPESFGAAVQTFRREFRDAKPFVVLGLCADKDVEGLNMLADKSFSAGIILTRSAHPRAKHFSGEEIKVLFGDVPCVQTGSVEEALNSVCQISRPDDIIFVLGSLFVVSEARVLCQK